jgi:hypothetical protein
MILLLQHRHRIDRMVRRNICVVYMRKLTVVPLALAAVLLALALSSTVKAGN